MNEGRGIERGAFNEASMIAFAGGMVAMSLLVAGSCRMMNSEKKR